MKWFAGFVGLAVLFLMFSGEAPVPQAVSPAAGDGVPLSADRVLRGEDYAAENVSTPLDWGHLNWEVLRWRSAMDDRPAISLTVESVRPFTYNGRRVTPSLTLRCQENRTQLYLDIDGMFDVTGYDGVRIRWRLDSDAAVSEIWSESTDMKAAFSPRAIAMARKMRGGERLLVEFIPYRQSPEISEFLLHGLEVHLPALAETCGWRL